MGVSSRVQIEGGRQGRRLVAEPSGRDRRPGEIGTIIVKITGGGVEMGGGVLSKQGAAHRIERRTGPFNTRDALVREGSFSGGQGGGCKNIKFTEEKKTLCSKGGRARKRLLTGSDKESRTRGTGKRRCELLERVPPELVRRRGSNHLGGDAAKE